MPSALHRVAIVDATPLLRRGLRDLLRSMPGVCPGIEAATPAEAIELCRQDRPDLVISAGYFPGGEGVFELLAGLRARVGPVPVLVFSHYDERLMATRLLHAGAQGFVMKSASEDELSRAILRVLSGKVHLSRAMTDLTLDHLACPGKSAHDPVNVLTNRELEILDLVGAGMASKEIAAALHISLKTVESHRAHIRTKLGLDHAAGLISYASQWRSIRNGQSPLVPPGDGI